ncbi:MAG: hypothetical protein E6G28_11455 [Actinobacteria bacterium]|nr:MAG: hypothetical protein E6G28_11455 [Actinomycetota bacterium]
MASRTVPLADAPALWRYAGRTRRIRLALAALLLALFAASLLTAFRLHTRPTSYFASSGNGIVALDLSASIDPLANARLRTLLRTIADSDQRLGLVVFEEHAYEMLPPGTRGDELRPMLRFFGNFLAGFGRETPWSRGFLEDASSDLGLLTEEIGRYRRAGIPLRVLPLAPDDQSLAFFTSLVGDKAIVSDSALRKNASVAEHQTVVAPFPLLLVVLELLLLLGLAANEYAGRSLEWNAA